jgi:hypothetical protein
MFQVALAFACEQSWKTPAAPVIPAQAGIQRVALDSRRRGNDDRDKFAKRAPVCRHSFSVNAARPIPHPRLNGSGCFCLCLRVNCLLRGNSQTSLTAP